MDIDKNRRREEQKHQQHDKIYPFFNHKRRCWSCFLLLEGSRKLLGKRVRTRREGQKWNKQRKIATRTNNSSTNNNTNTNSNNNSNNNNNDDIDNNNDTISTTATTTTTMTIITTTTDNKYLYHGLEIRLICLS